MLSPRFSWEKNYLKTFYSLEGIIKDCCDRMWRKHNCSLSH